MAVTKEKKSTQISELKTNLEDSSFAVVIHYRGMTGRQLYDLRVKLKAKECGMKIAKNTLISLAVKGTQFESLSSHFKGPTAILYSKDPVALSKIVTDTLKEVESLKIRIGYLDKALIEDKTIANLAKLGSLTDVRSAFLGKLNAVQSNFVRVLIAPQSGLASLFPGVSDKE